jgi:hypothetical protein
MGSSRWDAGEWASHSTRTSSMRMDDIYKSKKMEKHLDPSKLMNSKGEVTGVRESVDSKENPNSTPIILASDVTGSMGMLAELIIKTGLGKIMQEIYDRKPIPDPHILCAAIGDTYYDSAPLQATQFEADMKLVDQMKDFYIERGGGGNDGESYIGAWYFAAYKTSCDAMTKRGRKGYLFTIGDEAPLDLLPREHIKRFFGDDVQADMRAKELLDVVSQNWNVFHLIVKPVSGQKVKERWTDLLGQNAISVSDHEKLAEVIVSTLQVIEGAKADDVVASWSGDTSLVVAGAIGGLAKTGGGSTGVVRM